MMRRIIFGSNCISRKKYCQVKQNIFIFLLYYLLLVLFLVYCQLRFTHIQRIILHDKIGKHTSFR